MWLSPVPHRLCLQWRRWIFCLWAECQWLRLGDDQVHESRWCQGASRCAGESQVHLHGLDPRWEGDVLQLIPTAGREERWYVSVQWSTVYKTGTSCDGRGGGIDWHCLVYRTQPTFSHCSTVLLPTNACTPVITHFLNISQCSLFYVWLHSSTACGPRVVIGSLEAEDGLVIVIGLREGPVSPSCNFLGWLVCLVRCIKASQTKMEGFMIDISSSYRAFLPAFPKKWVSLRIIKCVLHFGVIVHCPDS